MMVTDAANTGKTVEQVAADTERDKWLSAQEALDYGIVDKIIESRAEAEKESK